MNKVIRSRVVYLSTVEVDTIAGGGDAEGDTVNGGTKSSMSGGGRASSMSSDGRARSN